MGIADDMKVITEDIIASYDLRVKALRDLVADTQKTLEGFASDRKKMSKEQLKALSAFVSDLTRNVRDLLEKFSAEHADMSKELREGLSSYVVEVKKSVTKLLNEYSSDMKKAKVAWKGMSKTIKKARKEGVMVKGETGVKETTSG